MRYVLARKIFGDVIVVVFVAAGGSRGNDTW